MTFEVRRYAPGDEAAWDELVRRSRSGYFLFLRGYMEYHADRFADSSLVVLDGSALVAALPASVDGATVTSHAGLTFGGLLTDTRMSTRRMLEILDAVRDHLAAQGAEALVYKAVPHIYHRVPAEEDLYALHRAGAELIRRDVSSAIRLDDRPPYTKGRKAALRVAQRSGVDVAASDDFVSFMKLQRDVLEARYDAEPVHSGEELELLAGRFPREITLHTATIEGRLVAGVVVYETPTVARAQYIAVSEEGRRLHALDAIMETLIASYAAHKRWWDFGPSIEPAGQRLNERLIRNKESYGARAVVYDRYRLDIPT